MESLTPRPELENSQGQSLHIDKPGPSARCPLYLQEPPNIRAAAKRRFVPEADSCSAKKAVLTRSLRRRARAAGTPRPVVERINVRDDGRLFGWPSSNAASL